MKQFITLLAIFTFNICFAQNKPLTDFLPKTKIFKAQLIESPSRIPDCGYAFINISLKFKVVELNNLGSIKKIIFKCPNENFGVDFFKKGNVYSVTAKQMNIVDIENLFNKDKSNEQIRNNEGWLCERITRVL